MLIKANALTTTLRRHLCILSLDDSVIINPS